MPKPLAYILVRISDLFACLLIAGLLTLGFTTPAYAYVDPSVMTYTIQALAGVAVALSTVIGVAWRRARKKIYKTLNIDENRNKIVEPDVCPIEADQKAAVDKDAMAPGSFGATVREDPDARYSPDNWRKRAVPAILIATFASATLLLVAPYEIVASNTESLVFTLNDIWLPIAIATLTVDIIVSALLLLFKGRAFKLACAIVFSFGLCCYFQALFMNFSLPAANGTLFNWDDYIPITVISALIWAAVFALVVTFSIKSSWKVQRIIPFLAAALIFIQGAGVVSLFVDSSAVDREGQDRGDAHKHEKLILTDDGLFDLAPANNVVVFILDASDTYELASTVENNPDDFKGFEDFTFFTDVSGSLVPTHYGMPFVLTGQLPSHDEDFRTYIDERFERSHFIQDIYDQGYSVDLYTDTLFNGMDELAGYVDNVHAVRKDDHPMTPGKPEDAVAILWKCALYRDMPWIFKAPFWFYTEEVNDAIFEKDIKDRNIPRPYQENDFRFYEKLKRDGLKIESTEKNGSFRLIHMIGSHEPYIHNENLETVPASQSSVQQQTLGVFKILDLYFQDMKDLGVYNDSTIIITSDHGHFDWGIEYLERPTSPIMFVKPANPPDPGQPMRISDIPITHGHFHPTVIEAVGGDYEAYGVPALSEVANDDPRYYLMTVHDGRHDRLIREYVINGDVKDFENWAPTGNVWLYENEG